MTRYTTKQAAQMLGISPQRVRQLAKTRGAGRKYGRDLFFSLSDIEKMSVRINGRPKQL